MAVGLSLTHTGIAIEMWGTKFNYYDKPKNLRHQHAMPCSQYFVVF
jgi:hypothetical protein